jgi:hypothetical protein
MNADDITVSNAPAEFTRLVVPIAAKYAPKEDITAYELSLLLPYLLGTPIYENDWQKLGAATRHLERLP